MDVEPALILRCEYEREFHGSKMMMCTLVHWTSDTLQEAPHDACQQSPSQIRRTGTTHIATQSMELNILPQPGDDTSSGLGGYIRELERMTEELVPSEIRFRATS